MTDRNAVTLSVWGAVACGSVALGIAMVIVGLKNESAWLFLGGAGLAAFASESLFRIIWKHV